jgi:ethanolamine transporter EutH
LERATVRTLDGEQGSVLMPTLIASLIGAVLAIAAAIVVVQSASDADAAPVQKPLITYDQR